MGPVAAVGWGVFALGSALAGLASRRIGVTRTAILSRVLNGLGRGRDGPGRRSGRP